MNLNHTLVRMGGRLPKPLQTELDAIGARYTSGLFNNPTAEEQTRFHFFHPDRLVANTCSVLFHGTGNDALFCWENFILDLLKSGRAVLTFDLPGHGVSSSTRLCEASFARCGDFLPKLLPELLPSHPAVEAIGYSLGALAALQLAALKQVTSDNMYWRALVLMALPERVSLSSLFIVSEALSFLQPGWWRQLAHYGWDASFPAFGPVRRARFPIRMESDIRLSYPAFVGQLLTKMDVEAALKRLTMPTLLIYGQRDRLATAAYAQKLSQNVRLIKGANHFMLPLAPEARRLVIDWLTCPQHPAAR